MTPGNQPTFKARSLSKRVKGRILTIRTIHFLSKTAARKRMIAALYSLPTTIESNRMCICNQVKRAEVRMRGRRGRHAIHSIARCDGGRAHCIHVTRARSARPPAHPLYYWHLANALSAYFMNTALRLIALHCLHFTPILEGLAIGLATI